jgi:hypothetical protein
MVYDLSSNNEAIADSYSATFKTPKREGKPADLVQLAGEPPKAETKPPIEDKTGIRAQTEAQIAATRATREYEEAKRTQSKGETAAKEAREAAVYAEYKPRLTAPYESFKPTGDTASSLASLGLMIGMLGAMGGKKGLTSATGAMNAIAGMMTGYQEGSKEKYNKERQIFEENLKIAQQNHALIEKEFERAVKYAKYDLTGATNAMIKSSLARGDTTTAKSIETRGLMPTAADWTQGTRKILGPLEDAKKKMYEAEEARVRAEGEVQARKAEKPTGTSQRPYTSQDETGQLVLRMPGTNEIVVDNQGKPIRPATAAMVTAASKGAGGEASPNSLQFRYNNAVAGASYRLATSMTNIVELPTFAKAPGLKEMISDPAKGLTGPMERYLAQKTTPEEDRAWQQQSARLLRAAGAIEAGGRPGGLTASAMAEYGNELVKPGDSRINKILSMALLKQELDFAEKELKVSGASKEQIRLAEESKAIVDKMIPYSVSDINRILRGGKSSLSSAVDKNLLDSVTNKKEFDNRMKIIDRIKEIPLEAKEMLMTNPTKEARDQFDAVFGKGSSYAIIGK